MVVAPATEIEECLVEVVSGNITTGRYGHQMLEEFGLSEAEVRDVFKRRFVLKNGRVEVWPSFARRWKPFKTICDVFAATTDIEVAQVRNLLILHGHADLAKKGTLGHLLSLGDAFGILSYRPKRGRLDVPRHPFAIDDSQAIHPNIPYSNIRSVEMIIKSCAPSVCWIDKHFSARGLDLLHDTIDGQIHKFVKVLAGSASFEGGKFARRAKRLCTELEFKDVKLEVRQLAPPDASTIHDRWLGGAETWYNIPPINSLLQNQHGEILRSTFRQAQFDVFWASAQES